ncbi:ATP-binding protein [Phenylobacterium sp.]|uniref:ATP-binding protein n=1 Tax=Phenylobacterium sp. TaxID=1871053 RepID=UPI00398305D8
MPLLQPPSLMAPRKREASLWPVVAAGFAGLASILALAALQRLDAPAAVAALLFIAATTALAMIVADRRAETDAADEAPQVARGAGEAAPYATLINALPDPILVIQASERDDLSDRRYVFANTAARELLRIQHSEGLLVTLVRDPQVLEVVDEALFGARDAETVYETGGVQARILRVHARPLGLALDGAHLALLAFRDETEVRRVERTRTDFLANASHELRTPLASLTGFIETLRGHAKDDRTARDRFLAIMHAQAERMSRLIDDLMSLSRIELNEHIAPDDEVDLSQAVMDVVDAVTQLARERGVVLEPVLARGGAARVLGDRDQIVQVAQNLIDNAVKYSPPGAKVRIEVESGLTAEACAAGLRAEAQRLSLLTPDHSAETYAVLRVTDSGAGIARENLPRLTERFYRVEGQKSHERAGTGLGLAIVKHIANRHRGGLSVESLRDQGTTFTVYFPLIAAPALPAAGLVAKVS